MQRLLLIALTGTVLALTVAIGAMSQLLATPAKVLTYGQEVRLAGTVPADRRSTGIVRILALSCGFSTYTRIAEFKMPATGAYSYRTAPTVSTLYSVRAGDLEVAALNVRVKPQLALTRLAATRFRADVTSAGGTTFGGKVIVFERARNRRGPWTKVAAPKVKHTSSPTALNAVGSATLTARLPKGTFVRARLAPASARPCYDGTVSVLLGL